MEKQKIKVKVEYSPGYEKRFSEAVLKRACKRPQGISPAADPAEKEAGRKRK